MQLTGYVVFEVENVHYVVHRHEVRSIKLLNTEPREDRGRISPLEIVIVYASGISVSLFADEPAPKLVGGVAEWKAKEVTWSKQVITDLIGPNLPVWVVPAGHRNRTIVANIWYTHAVDGKGWGRAVLPHEGA